MLKPNPIFLNIKHFYYFYELSYGNGDYDDRFGILLGKCYFKEF